MVILISFYPSVRSTEDRQGYEVKFKEVKTLKLGRGRVLRKNLPHSSLFAYTLASLLCFYHWVCKLVKPRLDEGMGSWLC